MHSSIADVPGDPELAVIAIPAAAVIQAVRACAIKGVRAVIVVSSGFEHGSDGEARRTTLLETCRSYGIRLIGPNCLGVVSTPPGDEVNASFSVQRPLPGNVAMLSDSGGIGIAAMVEGARAHLGLSRLVSAGDRLDVSSNDLLEYCEQDEATDVIALYLESFGNPRRFAEIARRIGERKPIIVVRSGRTPAGAKAAASHTGAMVAVSGVPLDSLLRHAGVIRADTVREMIGVAAMLARQPLAEGRRLAVLTNAGGPAILCLDAALARGLDAASLGDQTVSRLRALISPTATVGNPVDLLGSATPAQYRDALLALVDDPGVDVIVAIHVAVLATDADEVAAALARPRR